MTDKRVNYVINHQYQILHATRNAITRPNGHRVRIDLAGQGMNSLLLRFCSLELIVIYIVVIKRCYGYLSLLKREA